MLQLQRTLGNQAVIKLLSEGELRPSIQARLSVGPANDVYEQEAGRVAAQVVHSPASPMPVAQRAGKEEDLQTKPLASTLTPLLQHSGGFEADPEFEERLETARSDGAPLSADTRDFMEQHMGADFSGVKVHTDAQADRLNQALQAEAFTTGQDVFFRQGAYQPGSKGGQELIAHELAHVVQQGKGGVPGVQARILKTIDPTLVSPSALTRPTLASLALPIKKFIDETEVAGNPAKKMNDFFSWLETHTDNQAQETRVAKLKQDYETYYFGLDKGSWDDALSGWKNLDDKLEKLYMELIGRKVTGQKAEYTVGTNLGNKIQDADKAFNGQGWRDRGPYGGTRSRIPRCEHHYTVGAGTEGRPGAERVYVKDVALMNGQNACIAWYSSTHGDRHGPGDDVQVVIDNSNTMGGKRIVAPWNPEVPSGTL
jgi:hypothetical protein